jgi:uncharacterized protein
MCRFEFLAALAFLGALSCGCSPKPLTLEEDQTRLIGLPNGTQIRVEVMFKPDDLLRGMMYQDSLAPGRGMLFIHSKPAKNKYWMYRVKIPLDIIWLDMDKRIVEISADTPPCPANDPRLCPNYGGNFDSLYGLELAGGMAAKYGLKVGDALRF